MAEYLDKAVALSIHEPTKSHRHYQTDNLDDAYGQGWDDALCSIEHIPAADVVPVMHGRWKPGNPICPVCGGNKIKDLDADIWCEFNIPTKLYSKWDNVPNKLPLYQRKGRSKPNFAFLHKSAWKDIPQLAWHGKPTTDAELRAMTPPGFAWAFYEANK